ncbi:MAG: protein-tyrosine-phosphatase [Bacteroidota bacterium]|nr:protein-tyrosine-phosphatase [Bacteroidota bacterium]
MKNKILKLIVVFTVITFTSFAQTQIKLNKKLKKYAAKVTTEFNLISDERKKTLIELGDFILEDKQKNNKATLTFICTSNSRRSHLGQVWMQTAAIYYGIDSISTFSGGTEATEVNKRAVAALKRAGFSISRAGTEFNSPYSLTIGNSSENWILYSKKYDNVQNPKSNFIAVMVCSEADKSCPHVPGAFGRIGLPYEDPKYYDNTPSEDQKYDETCRLIARELFFVADYVKTKLILKKESAKK